MNEGINQNIDPNPKEKARLSQEKEEAEWEADYLARHPKQLKSPETLREAGPEIEEFESIVASFETTHSLEKLHEIVELSLDLSTLFERADDLADPKRIENNIRDYRKYNPEFIPEYESKIATARAIVLTPEDKAKFEFRRAAKKDIGPITAILDTLKKETNISSEKHDELKTKYKRLAKALGSINKKINPNKVDHS